MITPKEFAECMETIAEVCEGDTEMRHIDMDNAMCGMLEQLGYEEGVAIFRKSLKWYA